MMLCYLVDAFACRVGEGGGAGVVLAAAQGWRGRAQQVAQELNQSDTAFVSVLPGEESEGDKAWSQQDTFNCAWWTPATGVAGRQCSCWVATAVPCCCLRPPMDCSLPCRGAHVRPCHAGCRCRPVSGCARLQLRIAMLTLPLAAAAVLFHGMRMAAAHMPCALAAVLPLLAAHTEHANPHPALHFMTKSGRLTVAKLSKPGAILEMSLPIADPTAPLPQPFITSSAPFSAAAQPQAAQALLKACAGDLQVCPCGLRRDAVMPATVQHLAPAGREVCQPPCSYVPHRTLPPHTGPGCRVHDI